jgi:general secretion pathway protein C
MPSKNPPGLKVTYVKPNSLIYRLGLRRGDIITNINDISIRTPEDSFSAFERLKNSDSVTITVLRNGSKVELRYELE